MHTAEIQRAWREKIALVSLIVIMVCAVAFLTFGLQQALCRDEQTGKFVAGSRAQDVIVDGMGYYFNAQPGGDGLVWMHPSLNKDISSDPVDIMNYPADPAKGKDASFLFQEQAGGACEGLITRTSPAPATDSEANLYFPCKMRPIDGSLQPVFDKTPGACHLPQADRVKWANLKSQHNAPAYYTWENITNTDRRLFAYDGDVIDADILRWIKNDFALDDALLALRNGSIELRRDLSFMFVHKKMTKVGLCLKQIARVGAMDSKTIGCMTSDVITYVSLVIILGVVFIKFFLAVFFGWFLSHRLGGFDNETYQDRMKRAEQIEAWSSDINRPAFSNPKRQTFFPTTSRFTPTGSAAGSSSALGTPSLGQPSSRPLSTFNRPTSVFKPYTPPGSPGANFLTASNSSLNRASYFNGPLGPNGTPPPSPPPLPNPMRPSSVASFGGLRNHSRRSSTSESTTTQQQPSNCPLPVSPFMVQQPPVSYQPFNFPLIHTMALVTCYSEGIDGLRTTLDSIATTDYPNSHKLIVVICDGMIIGAGNNMSTPEICLSMMHDDLTPRDDVMAHSYVAIADGTKRHNMAKVYAGFYKYDDETVPDKKLQKRVPMCLIVKVGGPTEQNQPKPGNRGKRDSQIILMSFLQHVMFDERMTSFEYELFNTIWRVTGVAPDRYEIVLMVM